MISLVMAAMLMAAPAADPATTSAAPAAAADKKAPKPNKDGMICKKEAVLGSRMPSRLCMTQAQWDERKATDRDMVDQAQRNQPLRGN